MDFTRKLMRLPTWVFALPLALVLSTSPTVTQGAIIFGHTADTEIAPDGAPGGPTFNENSPTVRVGRGGAAENQARNAIFVFDLTGVGTIETATLELFLVAISGTPLFNGDLWGVGYSDVATIFPDTATLNQSATDSANQLIQDNFVTPTSTTGQYLGSNADALVNYLNDRTGDFVFFRLSQDEVAGDNNTFYSFTSANGTSAQLPKLTVSLSNSAGPPAVVLPEPGSMALWGLLLLVGICFWQRRRAMDLCVVPMSPDRNS